MQRCGSSDYARRLLREASAPFSRTRSPLQALADSSSSAALATRRGSARLAFEAAPDDFAIQQAYVALRAPAGNGLDLKLGVFDSVIGYESHDSGNNPNYTRSYSWTIEPTTFTGILATYQVCKFASVSAGVSKAAKSSAANSWNTKKRVRK